jgi:hypothetical protein
MKGFSWLETLGLETTTMVSGDLVAQNGPMKQGLLATTTKLSKKAATSS